ncbi:hypothetical protein DPMN_110944 [Dreissena polymorpha]|uniref:Uncharacterized protein n=1 Tax=Dreissena polymorpha TaxID=45954 RepID=A0A9D4KE51_DREPO|nr:hypothetical protein DPMN_110944 [Dreissena polymorpha]
MLVVPRALQFLFSTLLDGQTQIPLVRPNTAEVTLKTCPAGHDRVADCPSQMIRLAPNAKI